MCIILFLIFLFGIYCMHCCGFHSIIDVHLYLFGQSKHTSYYSVWERVWRCVLILRSSIIISIFKMRSTPKWNKNIYFFSFCSFDPVQKFLTIVIWIKPWQKKTHNKTQYEPVFNFKKKWLAVKQTNNSTILFFRMHNISFKKESSKHSFVVEDVPGKMFNHAAKRVNIFKYMSA